MFGMSETAISIYITQIPIALAIFIGCIFMLQIKKVFIEIFEKQIQINKQNIEIINNLKHIYEKEGLVYKE